MDAKLKVIGLLESLGNSRDEIAAKLVELDINGYIGSQMRCPIANYIRQELEAYTVRVVNDGAYVLFYRGDRIIVSFDYLNNGEHIASFIKLFDRGAYPELEQ